MIKSSPESKIKFFVPLSDIAKAKDANGNEIMKFGGIASTIDKDSDEEFLDPKGFDLSWFKKHGFINWHHIWKDKPKAIIGVPTKAEIQPKGFYIETQLFAKSDLAKEVYELGETLKEFGDPNRRLGFSVEGKVIQRGSDDPKNPLFKHIKKARITQVAITPTPKNSNTYADIVKGEYNDFKTDEYEEVLEKGIADGGTIYILDVTKPTGERITVDKDLNIKITKALSTAQNSGGPLVKEDLDERLVNLAGPSPKKKKEFTKSETYEEIYKEFPDLNPKQADSVYQIIEHINNKK